MQTLKSFLLIVAILISAFVHVSAQKSDKKDEQFKEITALIESGRYVFTVQSIQPTGARSIPSTSVYTLKADDSLFTAYLPYFGRAYQASYGGDGGIDFEAPPENLKISLNEKKRMVKVQFDIPGDRDKYNLFLSIGSTGYATLSINSQNRQPISYSGILGPPKEE